jgi:hypothetical protein
MVEHPVLQDNSLPNVARSDHLPTTRRGVAVGPGSG